MKLVCVAALLILVFNASFVLAQENWSGPIIDVHMHGPLKEEWGPPIEMWLEKFDQLNVKKVVVAAYPENLAKWVPKAPKQLIPSLMFPCFVPDIEHCFSGDADFPDVIWLRKEVQAGRIQSFGEVVSELYGIFPGDAILEPYFALAEEFDIPFGLHMGPGPEWMVETTPIYSRRPEFQISAGNPLELEPVLRRHPKLRLFVMHAGWPMGDEMLTILWHNPNVYIEVGNLQNAINRAEYYRYLRRLVDAGFGDRIMYGSDVGLDTYGEGIRAIVDAEFLTEAQKRDILYNNAARFLRLTDDEISAHHRR